MARTYKNGASSAYLGYDATGRLLFTNDAATTQTTYFDYDGDKMIHERGSGAQAILRRYVYGPGDDNPLVWYEGSGTSQRRWLHADERGSVIAMSNSTGAADAINSYDEYGIPASSNVGRFGYTGQTWLPEIGMNYYKARIYSPTLGRLMQTDPIGYKDGINWYDYVDGDPVNRTDPSGLYSCAKDDCNKIEQYRKQISDAKSNLGNSKFDKGLAKALGGILKTLGTKNDNNGLTVSLGKLDKNTLGLYSQKDKTITLDVKQINKSGFVGGGVLAHEVGHRAQDISGQFSTDTAKNYSDREFQSSLFEIAVNRGLGVSGQFSATSSPSKILNSANSTAENRCLAEYAGGDTYKQSGCWR